MRSWFILALGAVLGTSAFLRAQQPPAVATNRPGQPPLSYTCPMHPDVVEDRPGVCPRCRMTLEPVRLDTAYSCPVHTSVMEPAAGRCPVCRRTLVPITVTLFFTCAVEPAVRHADPITCPDGSAATPVRERRVHGDHNPRHGGQFFMAPDNWHHLEGTYPSRGLFRVYLYDDFTRPLPTKALQKVRGGAWVSGEEAARATGDTRETGEPHAVPLALSKDGRALEARVTAAPPARIALRLSFAPGEGEHRFDFSFPAYTAEPKPNASATTDRAAPTVTPPQSLPPISPAPTDAAAALQQLLAEGTAVDAAVANGAYGSIYIPALAAKDAALRLDLLAAGFGDVKRTRISSAVKRIVVAAWQLDMYGDLGDRERVEQAHREFRAGVDALAAAYAR